MTKEELNLRFDRIMRLLSESAIPDAPCARCGRPDCPATSTAVAKARDLAAILSEKGWRFCERTAPSGAFYFEATRPGSPSILCKHDPCKSGAFIAAIRHASRLIGS
jgi:hypothetical protein